MIYERLWTYYALFFVLFVVGCFGFTELYNNALNNASNNAEYGAYTEIETAFYILNIFVSIVIDIFFVCVSLSLSVTCSCLYFCISIS